MLNDAGKQPKWNQDFTIDIVDKDIAEITFNVLDEDPGRDDAIGSTTLKVDDLCAARGALTSEANNEEADDGLSSYTIDFNGKEAGKIFLSAMWTPSSHPDDDSQEGIRESAQHE